MFQIKNMTTNATGILGLDPGPEGKKDKSFKFFCHKGIIVKLVKLESGL